MLGSVILFSDLNSQCTMTSAGGQDILITVFVYTSFCHETYEELFCLFIQTLMLSVSLICSFIIYRISLNCFDFSLVTT